MVYLVIESYCHILLCRNCFKIKKRNKYFVNTTLISRNKIILCIQAKILRPILLGTTGKVNLKFTEMK